MSILKVLRAILTRVNSLIILVMPIRAGFGIVLGYFSQGVIPILVIINNNI